MRTSDSPFVIDWFVVSLRWLVILGLAASLASTGQAITWPNLLLAGLAVWNFVLSAIAGSNRRLYRHREISLGVDTAVAVLFFILIGGIASPGYWVIVLPVFTATLYFDWRGTLISALGMAGFEVFYTLLRSPTTASLIYALILAGVLLLAAAIFGLASRGLLRELRKERLKPIEARERTQQVESDRLSAINEHIRATYDLTSTLIGTLNYDRVLETVLDLSSTALTNDPEAGPDEQLVTAVLLFSGDELRVGSAHGLTSTDLKILLPGQAGLLAQAIHEGEPVFSDDFAQDPELEKIVSLRTCKSIYCFPLRSGFSIYGIMLFAHPEPLYFTAERQEVVEILGSQFVIAIQNARLFEDLLAEKKRMLEVQDAARKRLARDLQDGPTQSISAIAMRVNLAKRLAERDVPAALVELAKIEELALQTAREIHHMLFTLRPLVLESEGMTAALEAVAQKNKGTYGQDVIIKVDERLLDGMEMDKQGVIFFLAEDAINNARMHAEAPHVYVTLSGVDKDICMLEIRDDGLGFDLEAVERAYDRRGSLSMVNLRERAELINGFLHIESEPGRGTTVQVFIPITTEGLDRLQLARAN